LGVIIVDEIYPKRHFFCTRPMYPYQLSRGAGEGERAAPLSHCVGEGLGVRANSIRQAQPQVWESALEPSF